MKDDICVNKSAEIEIDTDVSSLSMFSAFLFAQKRKIKATRQKEVFRESASLDVCSNDLQKLQRKFC